MHSTPEPDDDTLMAACAHDDGLALDEVATALEVGFETTKTRLRYAMKKLRTCMAAYLAPVLASTSGDAP